MCARLLVCSRCVRDTIEGDAMKYKTGKVGELGEIVIDGRLREELGVGPEWRAFQFVDGGRLAIYFLPPDDGRPLAGSLAEYVTDENRYDDEGWPRVRDEAWAMAVREDF